MATYKEIKGVTVQTLDSDPVVFEGSWSSGGNMNTARELFASAGTVHTAALASAGYNGSTHVNNVEQYDGTSWTEVAEVNTARYYLTGFGSSTAALAIGGTPPVTTKTELWNGSAWTEVNDLTRGPTSPQASVYMMSSGASTSGLVYGGDEGASNKSALTESWDGTNWTEVGDLNTSRSYGAGSGTTNTAALCLSGFNWTPSLSASPLVEQYNGSAWTEIADVNTARARQAASNYGGVSTTLMFGGSPDNSTVVGNTESWDGSSWTEVNDLGTARWGVGGSGISTNALAFGGAGPPSSRLSATEEWTFPPVTAATLNEGDLFLSGGTTLKGFGKAAGIPAATWSSGGNLNEGRNAGSSAGTQTAALFAAGDPASAGTTANTESYNGTSWTEVNNLNTARRETAVGLGLTNAAALCVAGNPPITGIVESWDGTNWTEVADLNTSRSHGGSSGSQTSALAYGGNDPPYRAYTESWDGSSWTEVADLNTARYGGMFSAGQNNSSAITAGGYSTGYLAITETWNGSAWTEVADLNDARSGLGSSISGSTTSALAFGGDSPPATANTEAWNGSAWTEVNNLSNARNQLGGAGASGVSAVAFGGGTDTYTEEWTADNALADVTVS
jgi:hypothetical protein